MDREAWRSAVHRAAKGRTWLKWLSMLVYICAVCSVTQSCLTLCDPVDCSPPGYPWGFFRQEYWSGLPCPPPGDLPNPGIKNPGLPHCKLILYHLSHQGSPRMLKWVACPFSRGSSWPRNPSGVSCMAGGFFTSWPTREVHAYIYIYIYV